MTRAAEPFETLPMPRKDIPQPASGSYRVYKNAKEFVVVEAGSALEALQVSGVQTPHKIERDSIDYIRVLSPSAWDSFGPQTAAPVAEAKETVLIESPAAPAAVPETSLSNDDVNKLLNS